MHATHLLQLLKQGIDNVFGIMAQLGQRPECVGQLARPHLPTNLLLQYLQKMGIKRMRHHHRRRHLHPSIMQALGCRGPAGRPLFWAMQTHEFVLVCSSSQQMYEAAGRDSTVTLFLTDTLARRCMAVETLM